MTINLGIKYVTFDSLYQTVWFFVEKMQFLLCLVILDGNIFFEAEFSGTFSREGGTKKGLEYRDILPQATSS